MVRDSANRSATAYYLQPDDNGRITVGRGMCAGAFALERGHRFAASFALMDAAGNPTPWAKPGIAFVRPTEAELKPAE
ncbi:hypothetical protein [Hymenobacter latericus]|uniref:hypothetical protein n=1 Tax=Hymenobacter sp. YIM 151858-1 TaxID=2987688 RepID=UPI0022268022|nr:hypothetical protein [Hymenobacter sp. YIM 151858-1]UYZ57522.1 hypothetical protein OIS50_10620 [Hymenobacter sp. YIM 151858-1]